MSRFSFIGRRAVTAALITAAVALSLPASAFALDEYPVPTAGSKPAGIAVGPGGLWFTEEATAANKIGRITTGGAITEFGGLTPAPPPTTTLPETGPAEIVLGADGNLWFTEIGNNLIGRLNPTTGALTEFPVSGSTSRPDGIVAGPDNRLWFTQSGSSEIGAITVTGVVNEYPLPNGSNPSDIVVGPDNRLWFTESDPANKIGVSDTAGNIIEYDLPAGGDPSGITASAGALWFTEFAGDRIGRIPTVGGTQNIQEFPLAAGSGPSSITTGADGALWFTESTSNKIGRITAGGSVTELVVPTPGSEPSGIAAGPDSAIWFTEFLGNKVGRIAVGSAVAPPPPPPPAPTVLSLRVSPRTFAAARSGPSISARTRTTVTYGLSISASTRFTVERETLGRKKGRKCVRPNRRNRRARRCKRYLKLRGSFSHAGQAGSNRFRFSGRLARKRLRPGRYRLVALATAGTTTSSPKRTGFRIVRR